MKNEALLYYVIELIQGSRDWHEWRMGGIGASDAPAVLRYLGE